MGLVCSLLSWLLSPVCAGLYSLTLDGIFITAHGLRELVHCPNLHILSLTDCLNVLNKSAANLLLKDSLKHMAYLAELNLTRSRLSGRMMSSHPNLKLEVLIANGCPISSFAIRMLSSSSSSASASTAAPGHTDGSSSAAGVAAPAAQNMCKYSLRQLCLSGCAFINRKSVEYIFKFAYLSLLDVSECRGLKASEITEAFRSQAESEIRHLEAVLAGTSKRSSRSSSSSGSSSSAAVPSSFATLLCSLRHLICFGLSGTGMSDKRAADLARDLNAYGAKVQQLLLMHHHQQQAQKDAAAQAQADASGNNLAPPMAIRSAPPATPSWLRRDFHADPIIVIAQRNSPLLRNYRPTLTRFVTQQQASPHPQGGLVSRVVAVPAGMDAGAAVGGASGGTSSPPPLFRGLSLLEDCPYTYLPSPLTTSNPTAATPGHVAASSTTAAAATTGAAVSPSTTNTAVTAGRPAHAAATAVPPQSTAPRTPFHGINAIPVAVGAYMTMAEEHAGGGTATSSTSHQNVAALAAARLSSAHQAQAHAQAHAHAQHPAHTWQALPHSASVPGVATQGGGGELYSVMQRSDMFAGASGSQKHGGAKFHSDGFSDEGIVRPNSAAGHAAGGLSVPSAQMAALSLAPVPAPRPVAAVAPALAGYASVPNMAPAPAPALPAASLAFPSVGMPLPASHLAPQSNLAAPPSLAPNNGSAAGAASAPPTSGVPSASFWGSIGQPTATATPASAPPAQPLFAATPSVPSAGVFVSPFAALSRPPSAVAPVGGFASPFGVAPIASAPSTPASVSALAAVAGHVSPLQPGMSLFPDLPDPAAALAAAAASSPVPADVGQLLPADSLMHQLMPPSLLLTPSPAPPATPNSFSR